jgi:hypothetical protein
MLAKRENLRKSNLSDEQKKAMDLLFDLDKGSQDNRIYNKLSTIDRVEISNLINTKEVIDLEIVESLALLNYGVKFGIFRKIQDSNLFLSLCYKLTKNLFYIEDQKFFKLRKQKMKEEIKGKKIQNADKKILQHFDGMPYQLMDNINFGEDTEILDLKNQEIDKFAMTIQNEMNINIKDVMKILGNKNKEEGIANRFRQEVDIINPHFLNLYLKEKFKKIRINSE